MHSIALLLAIYAAYEVLGTYALRLRVPNYPAAYALQIAIHGAPSISIFWLFRPEIHSGGLTGFFIGALAGIALRVLFDMVPDYVQELRKAAECACGQPSKVVEINLDTEATFWQGVLHVSLMGVLAPLLEEIFYRALLERAAAASLGPIGAALLGGVLFSAGHVLFKPDTSFSWSSARIYLIRSLVFSACYAKLGLAGAAAAHGFYNAFLLSVLILKSTTFPMLRVPLLTHFPIPDFIHGRWHKS